MPLGSTHDRITLWTLPAVTLGSGLLTRDAAVTLAVSAAYLFSGLMFSGDLDIRSRQYQRWLILRWIWLPYRKAMRHRSLWSHGPIVGTVLRILYISLWIVPLILGILNLGTWQNWWPWTPEIWLRWLQEHLLLHTEILLGIGVGLELGSTNHSLSDWTISGWKRWRRSQEPQGKRTGKSNKLARSPRLSSQHKGGPQPRHQTSSTRSTKTTRRSPSRVRSGRSANK